MTTSATNHERLPANIVIRHTLRPGDIGSLIALHGTLYTEECGWDHTFETYVAGTFAESDPTSSDRSRLWIVEKEHQIRGAIAILERSQEMAQLRWFLLHPDLRGLGIGKMLVKEAMAFCHACSYTSVVLHTVKQLETAAALYRSHGFQLVEEFEQAMWGAKVIEQKYEVKL